MNPKYGWNKGIQSDSTQSTMSASPLFHLLRLVVWKLQTPRRPRVFRRWCRLHLVLCHHYLAVQVFLLYPWLTETSPCQFQAYRPTH